MRTLLAGGLHRSSLDDNAMCDVLPQGDEQLARQRDDGALAASLAARTEPARQRRLRLMAQPKPGELDHQGAQPRIAGLRQALLVDDRAASPGCRRKARIGCDLPAIGELSTQSFRPEN